MKKGQLVKFRELDVPDGYKKLKAYRDAFEAVYIIVRGPYEGIFSEGRYSRLAKVVDVLSPTGDLMEKVECSYLVRA